MKKNRCSWVNPNSKIYMDYHDCEWGVPVHDDNKLFEMLILEGFQAGLSWITILNKRDNFRKAFDNFDYHKISTYDIDKIEILSQNAGIIRNKLKIKSSIINARVFIQLQTEYGSFAKFLWSFVNFTPIKNNYNSATEVPTHTKLSDEISKILRKKGMKFVGTKIIYSYMQAIGIVNDHTKDCYRYYEI